MPLWGIAAIFFGCLFVFSVIHFLSRKKHPGKRALISMIIGALALTAVDLCSGFTGVYITVSLLSILVSVIGGVPGVALLLILNIFL